MGKAKKICNDCEWLKVMTYENGYQGYCCTAQKNCPEIIDIMKPCNMSAKPKGCSYCRGETPLIKQNSTEVWLKSNTNHPKDCADILMMQVKSSGNQYAQQLAYCPMCKRKFI